MRRLLNIFLIAVIILLAMRVMAHAGGDIIYYDVDGEEPPSCTWKSAWSATTVAGSSTWGDYNAAEANRRTIINAADLSYGGDSIRLVFQGHSSNADSVHGMSIGPRSSSTEDYNAAPTRVTCSAANTCDVPAGSTVTSDNMSFTISSTSNYLVHVYTGDATNNYEAYLTSTGAGYEQLTATDYTMTQDVTMSTYGFISHLSNIEVCTTE